MSFYQQSRSVHKRFRLILASFLQRPDLPFADVLAEQAIEKAFDDEDATFAEDQDAVFTLAVTLWAFLSQVLFKDEYRSCVAAVARVAVLLVALERGPFPATQALTVGHASSFRKRSFVTSPSVSVRTARTSLGRNCCGMDVMSVWSMARP